MDLKRLHEIENRKIEIRKTLESNEKIEKERENNRRYPPYLTYDEFHDWDYIEYETFSERYTTPNGETVVAFGYY